MEDTLKENISELLRQGKINGEEYKKAYNKLCFPINEYQMNMDTKTRRKSNRG